ncbi:radical SAM protein [Thermobacillus sp. ZCTH02-B1]|uniref:SPL family radical SAM protein n=1 Tax=Thermobacillus sp. ZCTH02-B1 TaxID=1858795 RepID=UPI0025D743DD|nr:radical SAM protein [Thermobacillus sp. ZCTH02-B1]
MRPTLEPMAAKTILNRVRVPAMPFDWSINPYRGCQHGCSFCYARSTHAFLGRPADDTFQRHIYWKEGAPDILRGQLARMARLGRMPGHVAVGTATDPYQPLEAKAKLTRGCLEALADYGVPFSVTTRSPLVLRDLDILRRARVLSVNISLHTLDMRIWRRFEPASPAPWRRLETIARLADAGIPVTVFAAPMLPYLTDTRKAAAELAEACAAAGAGRAMVDFLRLQTPEVKQWFFGTLERHDPELVPAYGRLYYMRAGLPDSYLRPARERVEAEFRRRGLIGRKPKEDVGRTPVDGRFGAEGTGGTDGSGAGPVGRADGHAAAACDEERAGSGCTPLQLTLF